MNDVLRNPILLFLAGVLTLWLVFKFLKIMLSLFWLVMLVFVVMFVFNSRFRNILRGIFSTIFR